MTCLMLLLHFGCLCVESLTAHALSKWILVEKYVCRMMVCVYERVEGEDSYVRYEDVCCVMACEVWVSI